MTARLERLRRLLPAAWLGALACLGLLVAPVPFARLPRAEAGALNGALFTREAWASIVLALLLWGLERARARRTASAGQGSVLSAEMVLLLGVLLCTAMAQFGVQPAMEAARAGQGAWSFGALHGTSVALYGAKLLLVALLAWRATASAPATTPAITPASS